MNKLIVCISTERKDTDYPPLITLYKIYEVFSEEIDRYFIINDIGIEFHYPKNNFITLAQWRNNQINSILNL